MVELEFEIYTEDDRLCPWVRDITINRVVAAVVGKCHEVLEVQVYLQTFHCLQLQQLREVVIELDVLQDEVVPVGVGTIREIGSS